MGGAAGLMYYLESPSADPAYNLALEQVVFDRLGAERPCVMLWRNDRAVIVGKHQNTLAEVDPAYTAAHGIKVVRRLSGGGAVYHDLGNVNYTFVAPHTGGLDFAAFCAPVLDALASLGVSAQLNGRNDLAIDGKKCSGNAQFGREGRVMHHGTLLYDVDLDAMARALRPPADKLASKGVASVRARVTNIRPYVAEELDTLGFLGRLRDYFFRRYPLRRRELTADEAAEAERLRAEVYDAWAWNYGASPPCQIVRERRVEGCGRVELRMDVKEGRIAALAFAGDFFSLRGPEELAARLAGCPLEGAALRARLAEVDVDACIRGLDGETLSALLLP